MSKRFDTWFYLTILQHPPTHPLLCKLLADSTETSAVAWHSLPAIMRLALSKHVSLPPPTCYTVQDLWRGSGGSDDQKQSSGGTLGGLQACVQRRRIEPYTPWTVGQV
jgi:hypothetical protein